MTRQLATMVNSGMTILRALYVLEAQTENEKLATTISAVRNHAIVRIDDSIASRWGPRVVNFVRAVASALRIARS